jgi:hypothetical protein
VAISYPSVPRSRNASTMDPSGKYGPILLPVPSIGISEPPRVNVSASKTCQLIAGAVAGAVLPPVLRCRFARGGRR